jgi:hypothetical protein
MACKELNWVVQTFKCILNITLNVIARNEHVFLWAAELEIGLIRTYVSLYI